MVAQAVSPADYTFLPLKGGVAKCGAAIFSLMLTCI
jgi:hypothetical protein